MVLLVLWRFITAKEPYIKEVGIKREGICPVRVFSDKGCSSDSDVRTLLQKNFRFSENYLMSALRTDIGFEAVRIFYGQLNFVQTSFMNGHHGPIAPG